MTDVATGSDGIPRSREKSMELLSRPGFQAPFHGQSNLLNPFETFCTASFCAILIHFVFTCLYQLFEWFQYVSMIFNVNLLSHCEMLRDSSLRSLMVPPEAANALESAFAEVLATCIAQRLEAGGSC